MHLDRYAFIANTNKAHFDYEFESDGPKGVIKKVVRFSEVDDDGLYNLAFGDLDENTGEISDLIATNNADTEKVLVTIAVIADDFTKKHPGTIIAIQGSTKSRTRLYQINIAKYWSEINKLFVVLGLLNETWESFEKGNNYEAFAAYRRGRR